MTGLKVHVHPADEGGCGWYRLRWVAAELAAQGHDVTVLESLVTVNQDMTDGRRLIHDVHTDADVVVLQRPLLRSTFDMIAPLQKRGVAVVVEIDDDFHSIPEGHSCKRPGVWSPTRSPRWIRRACQEADLVTVTTPALALRYAPHGRVMVLPNMVPKSYLNIPLHLPGQPPVVGWTGSLDTHVGDLEATEGAVALVLDETGARFHVIGTGWGVREALGLTEYPSTTNGWTTLTDYPRAYAGLDIAIVPLAKNVFNEAKSDLKGLEALALGMPFVASDTSPYRTLATESSGGLLALSQRQWAHRLTKLIRTPELRAEMGARGREYVAGHRTVEGQAWRWWEAWTLAVESHRARTRVTSAV